MPKSARKPLVQFRGDQPHELAASAGAVALERQAAQRAVQTSMTSQHPSRDASLIAVSFQDHILPMVSRTFALTIPQLPGNLRVVVANAYLLCRIADTIEDEPAMSAEQKERLETEFAAIVASGEGAEAFAAETAALLSDASLPSERDLVANCARVLEVTAGFSAAQKAAIARCLRIMCAGMRHHQREAGRHGLRDLAEMDLYCYHVAGVVGEMLTDLFSLSSPKIAAQRDAMFQLAPSFGQGLQMTNILKDVWEDLARGACWLPAAVFDRHGFDILKLAPGRADPRFRAAYSQLIGVAHAHLRNAMNYTLMIPAEEKGIRRFCAWAIGMAILTLDKINSNLDFASGTEVKISRRSVAWTILLTRVGIGSDAWLRLLFDRAARTLPLTPLSAEWSVRGLPPKP